MNSQQIFKYSEDFLEEIIEDLIKLKIQKTSNPKNNSFDNKLKAILGKKFEETKFQNIISSSDNEFKSRILDEFNETRNERIKILGEDYAKDIEKRIFLQSID